MNPIVSAIAVIAFIIVTIDVWRSAATTGAKIVWTIAALIFSIITLIVWFAWGRKRAYSTSGVHA